MRRYIKRSAGVGVQRTWKPWVFTKRKRFAGAYKKAGYKLVDGGRGQLGHTSWLT